MSAQNNNLSQVHLVTKSLTSLLIGLLVDNGDLSVNDALGQIFTNEATWEGVEDVEFCKVRRKFCCKILFHTVVLLRIVQ